jgi:hypothetical protein
MTILKPSSYASFSFLGTAGFHHNQSLAFCAKVFQDLERRRVEPISKLAIFSEGFVAKSANKIVPKPSIKLYTTYPQPSKLIL